MVVRGAMAEEAVVRANERVSSRGSSRRSSVV